MGKRMERVNETLAREVAQTLRRMLGQQRFLATIARVDTTPNLASAKVYVRVFPKEYEKEAQETIIKFVPRIQEAVGKRIKMRRIPRLLFVFEVSRGDIAQTEKLLEDLDRKYGKEL